MKSDESQGPYGRRLELHGGVETWVPIEKQQISVIVVSAKPHILTDLSNVPVPFELIVDHSPGLGLARNNGARKAKNSLIVFVDDDVKLDKNVWSYVLSVKDGEIALPFVDRYGEVGGPFPNSRVLAVHKKDFWFLGGFDESLRCSCEDRDFYYRARRNHFSFRIIPFEYITHIPHSVREANIHKSIIGIRDRAKVFCDYGVRFPELFNLDFKPRIKTLQAKHLLIETLFLLWFIFKKPFAWWKKFAER